MQYKIITDDTELKNFIDWLPELQEHETYYFCLFARNKYCKELVHIKSDKAQLKRFTSSKRDIWKKIKQLEVSYGAYTQKDTIVPQEALALYMTPNPRNMWRATFSSLRHLSKCIEDSNRGINPHQEVLSEIQKTKSRNFVVDFDIDSKEVMFDEMPDILNKDAYRILETRGGFHLLVHPDKVASEFKKDWHKHILNAIPNIDQTGDQMIPVPGTYQGGFTPKFIQ